MSRSSDLSSTERRDFKLCLDLLEAIKCVAMGTKETRASKPGVYVVFRCQVTDDICIRFFN